MMNDSELDLDNAWREYLRNEERQWAKAARRSYDEILGHEHEAVLLRERIAELKDIAWQAQYAEHLPIDTLPNRPWAGASAPADPEP